MKNILNLFTLITLMIVSVSCSDILSPKEFKYSDLVGNWKDIFKDSTKDINFAIRENGGILSESTAFSGKVEGMENNLDSTVSSAKATIFYGGPIAVEFTSSSYGEGKYEDGTVVFTCEKQ